jgi:hypothetical protein
MENEHFFFVVAIEEGRGGNKVEATKLFRLYSSFTVEENVLILAKQNKISG